MIVQVRKTYKYRLYKNDNKDHHLHDQINIAGIIWNHIAALQKRYYRIYGKHISENKMKKHIAKLRMKASKFAYWKKLGSQAVQEICERHEKVYENFFKKQGGLPRFKKVKKFRSFVLKQAGYKVLEHDYCKKYRVIKIGKKKYKFVYHRAMSDSAKVKTISILRDSANRLWICFSVIENMNIHPELSTGKIGGFDFGLKTFLTTDEGQSVDMPEFYKEDMPRLKAIQSQVSRKSQRSKNNKYGKDHIARRHIRIADKRKDFHYQLAHDLCDQYDILVFEDLNIQAMKKLWGRKISDLGFTQFMQILEWVAFKRGKRVIYIDRFERTTGKCSKCGHKQKLTLDERTFECQNCGLTLDRDHNAAINIRQSFLKTSPEAGHRLILSQSIEDFA